VIRYSTVRKRKYGLLATKKQLFTEILVKPVLKGLYVGYAPVTDFYDFISLFSPEF